MQRIPRLLLIFDGMGDRPIVELGDKTPLQAANLPVMDQLALEGQCGVADPVRSGTVATTVMGTLAILGYDPLRFSIARGLIEAIGCGMKIMPGDVAFRGNWLHWMTKELLLTVVQDASEKAQQSCPPAYVD